MVINKQVEVTELFHKLRQIKEKICISIGGAGSSKSYSQTQFFIFDRLIKYPNYNLLVLRKTRHSNKLTSCKLFIDLLKEYGLYSDDNYNMTDLIYTFPETHSLIRFDGLDKMEKYKSSEWDDIFIEEVSECDKENVLFLKTRLTRKDKKYDFLPRVWCTLNPTSCWVQGVEGKEGYEFLHSTYKDNPFISADAIKTLEDLKNEDEAYYKIYALGEWAELTNIIYKPFIIEKQYPETFEETIFGLDFGFNNPTALVRIDIKDREFYITEVLYKSKLTNGELIKEIKSLLPRHVIERSTFYADCAEPARIVEFNDRANGFNVIPADKSVKDGIDFVKRQKIHTLETNININEERRLYKYKSDSRGVVLDEPVKFKDHALDALRYALYTHFKDNLNVEKKSYEIIGAGRVGTYELISGGRREIDPIGDDE